MSGMLQVKPDVLISTSYSGVMQLPGASRLLESITNDNIDSTSCYPAILMIVVSLLKLQYLFK